MKVPEVCNANMTSLPIDIVHSLVKSQTSFQAGKLKHFLPQWEAITADPTILQIVTGVKIEFKSSVAPTQHYGRPSVFNSHQHSIVNAEIDTLLVQGDTSAECHKNVTDTITLFTKLGFHIHPEKSVFIHVLDSIPMTATLTEEKLQRILSVCASLLKTQMPAIRQVAEVIGILVSNFPGAQYGPLHYRHPDRDKYLALVANKGDYGGGKCNYPLPL